MQRNAEISKIKKDLVLTGIFSETTYVCGLIYVCAKFEVFEKLLKSFNGTGILIFFLLPAAGVFLTF